MDCSTGACFAAGSLLIQITLMRGPTGPGDLPLEIVMSAEEREDRDRMFSLVETSTRESAELRARVSSLEERIESLERTVEDRIRTLEEEMGTMNAHLDNIARESAIANEIARKREEREREGLIRKEQEQENERKRLEEARKDKIEIAKRSAKAVWEVLKFPLSTLMTGIVAWLLYWYFYVPDNYDAPEPSPQMIEERGQEDGG